MTMTMEEMIQKFIQVKSDAPSDADELLDFIQQSYIRDELSIVSYRNLYRELDARGAKKPEYFSKEMIG